MIIDKEYIIGRIHSLIESSQFAQQETEQRQRKLIRIKYGFPAWLRKIIFHPFNPVFSMWKLNGLMKREKNTISCNLSIPLALDFIRYCLMNDPKFDTSVFFMENQTEDLVYFIDNKIKCLFASFDLLPMNEKQLQVKTESEQLNKKIKKQDAGYYSLSLPERKYILPVKNFDYYVFGNHYGLDELSFDFHQYLNNKSFLDIGAFIGDTAIMLLQYNPDKIYAYEPVSENYSLLTKTIEKNNTDKIIPVKKGLGDTKCTMHINIDSSCSTMNLDLDISNILTEEVEVSTIDEDCKDIRIGLIKMDVEGFEYYVIKGGLKTIQRDKPMLLISIYHRGKDFFEIPPMILSTCPEYKFKFVDIYPNHIIAEKIIIGYV